jgi:hypothetical protein
MMRQPAGTFVSVGAALLLSGAVSGCMAHNARNAQASDTWTRSYPVDPAAEVRITNPLGKVEVEGIDGSTVEVEAERIAHGATEQLARDLVPQIPIKENISPKLVSIETGKIDGILLGASYEVRYHVKVPHSIALRAVNVNGGVDVRMLSGRVSAQTVNGAVSVTDVSGGLDARAVNGGVNVRLSALGTGNVALTTVNGRVRLELPPTAKATVTATWLNGAIRARGLTFDVVDDSKRRFEGRLNGGGTPIDLRTTNGGIVVAALGLAEDPQGTPEDERR